MSWRFLRSAGQIAVAAGIAGLAGACSGDADSAGSTSLTLATDVTVTSWSSAPTEAEATAPPVGMDENPTDKPDPGASPAAARIMNEFAALGLCDAGWVSDLSDLESVSQQIPVGAPLPQESWSCSTQTTSVGLTRWSSADELQTFFATLTGSDQPADVDFDKISALRLDGAIVVGAFDSARGASIVEVLQRMQGRLGGEVVSYADLAR